ncbi:MAG: O-antigen ligase family protein [Pseudobdellovibrio sp.]
MESENPVYLQIGMALSACFTVYLYSRVIPSELSAHKFFIFLKNISLTFCLLSLVALVLFPDLTFKGGRFIGVFKHIPYMVTTATVACGFMIYDLFATNKSRYKKILIFCCLLLCLLTLILTGTRSALLAVILSYFIAFVVFPAKKALSQFLKVSTAITCLLGVLFFGNIITDHVINVIRGNESVGLRAAQDGVASRLDEFQRGLKSFQNSPFLGHGLLSKFGEINENDVGQYNANKDPHNLLVSAGVIGGIFFIVIVALGFLILIFKSMQKLKSKDPVYKVMAIYMITQLPILFIYHMHLSMGGMADRVYWLIVGYMCIKEYTHSTRG